MPQFIYQHTRSVIVPPDKLLLPGNANRVLLVAFTFPPLGAFIAFGELLAYKIIFQMQDSPIPLELRRVDIGDIICEPIYVNGLLGSELYVTEASCINPEPGRLGC